MLIRNLVLVAPIILVSHMSFAASPERVIVVPPAPKIVDGAGNAFAVTNGLTLRNGVPDTASGKTFRLFYQGGHVFKKSCSWYQLRTSKWPAGDSGWQILPTTNFAVYDDCPK